MAAEPRSLDYGWAGGAVLQSAVQCMVAPDQLGGHFGSIQRRPWHGVVSWCVVGQRMLLCSPPQVVYVHAVARVHALRCAVGWVGFSGGSGGVRAAPAGIHWPVECLLGWVVVGLCVWQRCASLHITCTHGRARMAASEARAWPPAHPHLPCHTPVPLPPSHLACRLRVLVCGVGVARGVLWWQAPQARAHMPSQTLLGGSLSSRLVRWPAPSPARRRCQTSPEPKGRLLPSHVVPCATRAPIVARAHPALHAHVVRMTCLSQCLQHDPATRVPTVLTVSRPTEVIA